MQIVPIKYIITLQILNPNNIYNCKRLNSTARTICTNMQNTYNILYSFNFWTKIFSISSLSPFVHYAIISWQVQTIHIQYYHIVIYCLLCHRTLNIFLCEVRVIFWYFNRYKEKRCNSHYHCTLFNQFHLCATGCHFKGPIALRHRLSPALPNYC